MKSTVLTRLLKFIDLGNSYLRVILLPVCSIVYLMVFTSASARACVESYAVLTTLSCTVSTSAPTTWTPPESSATVNVRGLPCSTLRVLLSSNWEEIFCRSNGLLVRKPLLAAKNATAPIPASTNSKATTKRIIIIGLFISVLLVYKVFSLRLTEELRKSFRLFNHEGHEGKSITLSSFFFPWFETFLDFICLTI